MRFSYPDDLVHLVIERWLSTQSRPACEGQFPAPDSLRHLLETTYHASFLKEEGRTLRFTVAYLPRRLLPTVDFSWNPDFAPIPFEVARDFTPQEVQRLAPATNFTRTFLCVEPSPPSALAGECGLQIWGLASIGSSWDEYRRYESGSGRAPPDCLAISSSGPGILRCSREAALLVTLTDGKVLPTRTSALSSPQVKTFLRPTVESFHVEVIRALDGMGANVQRPDIRRCGKFYVDQIRRLLGRIQDQAHGGTLLIVRDLGPESVSRLSSILDIKYRTDLADIWSTMHRTLIAEVLEDSGSGLGDLERSLSDFIHVVASATDIDGAVVITDTFRLLGFGAEIVADVPQFKHVREVRDDPSGPESLVSIDSFGTRHRSAARFAFSVPESLSFVVSQSGSARLFRNDDETVLYWAELDLRRFTE